MLVVFVFCWFGLDLMLFLVGLVRLVWVCLLFARFLVFIYFITWCLVCLLVGGLLWWLGVLVFVGLGLFG